MGNAQRIVDWDQLYPGQFFKAGELAPNEKKILTVSDVELVELEGNKGLQVKGVVSFEGERQKLPLNKTNGICLREMFGRVPYKWVGHRFAIFASPTGGFDGEPCIRIWGSPELAEDLTVTIELPRKKPTKMVMRAMGDEQSLRAAGRRAATKLEAVREPEPMPLGERCQEVHKMIAAAVTDEDLVDLENETCTEEWNARERRSLDRGFARRREAIIAAQASSTVIT